MLELVAAMLSQFADAFTMLLFSMSQYILIQEQTFVAYSSSRSGLRIQMPATIFAQ